MPARPMAKGARWAVCTAFLLGLAFGARADIPDIQQPGDTRPNRGDLPGSPHVTGPASPIHSFYNDDLEISFWSGPADMAFSLAKNDVWDRRYFANNKHIITLDDVHRVCFGDEKRTRILSAPNSPGGCNIGLPNTPHEMYLAYDFPCPKPVGQIIVHCPDLIGQDKWQAGSAGSDVLSARADNGPARAGLSGFLHRTRNLLVLRGEYSGLQHPVQLQLYRHQDTTPQDTSIMGIAHFGGKTGYDYARDKGNGPLPHPTAGSDGRFFWTRQTFPADPTFPQGFEVVTMGCVDGVACATSAQSLVTGAGAKPTIHPLTETGQREVVGWLKELRIEAERMGNAESGALATAELSGASPKFTAYITVVTTRDAADPMAAARRALVEASVSGPEALLAESISAKRDEVRRWRLSRVMHYNATSCTWADATPWHGDYHFNEVYATADIVNGNTDNLMQRLRMCEEMLPALKRNAQEMYGCRGIAFSLVHYPIKSDHVVYSNVVWELGLENTALMLQPLWQMCQYTGDKELLRQRVYPLMLEGARFYADYVKKGDDGLYHVIPTVSQEHRGLTPRYQMNRDSVGALSFVRYHLKSCIEASELLGLNADERAKWREIIAHLAPYPTLATPEGPVFTDVRDAPDLLNYNITANLVMTLFAEDISLDSPPDVLEMARRSYRAIPDKEHSMRPGYLSQVATFLGIPERPDTSPQGRVLSWPGRIHLYPGVPQGVPVNDSFDGLLAIGGFAVSATHSGTEIRGVRITSRIGRLCKLASPWPASTIIVLKLPSREVVTHKLNGDTISFATAAGTTYAVLGGNDLPLADKRFAPEEKTIAKWSFRQPSPDTIADESGHGHTVRLVGGAAIVTGSGLELKGPQAFAQVERQPDFDFAADESFAIEARIKFPPGVPVAMTPIVCSMAERQYCFMLANGRPQFYLSSPGGAVNCQVSGESVLTDGKWHTLRALRDVAAGTISVAVDGRTEGSATDLTAGDFTCTAPLTIGAYLWGGNSRYARATIADVSIKSLGRLVPRG